MKRKIIKQGHNTLTVTLPSDWVKRLNVKAGDEMELIEKEHALILNGLEQPKSKQAVIEIDNYTIPLIWRYFQAAYRAGCDEITVKFDVNKKNYEDAYHFYTTQFDYAELGEKMPSKPAIMMIQGIVDRFVGLNIIETGKGYCVIREIAQPSTKEFENSLRRVFLITGQMLERVIEVIDSNEKHDVNICKEFHAIDLNVDKLVDYCCRILNKNVSSFDEQKKMVLFSILFILELVGDEFKYIGKHFATTKKGLKDIKSLAVAVKSQFDLCYKLFYTYDRETAILFGKGDCEMYSQHFEMRSSCSADEKSIARHLMVMSKFILSLVELRLQLEFVSTTA